MAKIIAYLKFNGNCREAMTFYKECFGGELNLQTIKGSALEGFIPAEEAQKILHSSLINDELSLYASEMEIKSYSPGNTVFLWLNCSSEQEIKTIFTKLAAGGKIDAELQIAYWGSSFGAITDKFGMKWYISSLQ